MKKEKENFWLYFLLVTLVIALIGSVFGTYYFIKDFFQNKNDFLDLIYSIITGSVVLVFCFNSIIKTLISIYKK